MISAFSGTTGLVVKIVLLSLVNAFAAWSIYVLTTRSHWIAVAVLLAAATVGIDLVYLGTRRWTLPLKFLVPGTVFLVGFQVIPILYTIQRRVHELLDRPRRSRRPTRSRRSR